MTHCSSFARPALLEARPSARAASAAPPRPPVLARGLLLGCLVLGNACAPPPSGDSPETLREVASRLASVGVVGEAARTYELYLDRASLEPEKRAAIGITLARLYKDEGQLERALGILYRVEDWAPGSTHAREAAPLIVEVLEKLGRGQAAQTALASRSRLEADKPSASVGSSASPGTAPEAASTDSPVLARIDGTPYTLAQLDQAMAFLPEAARNQLEAPEAKRQFLQDQVAQELLYQKALKRAVEKEPEVRRQLEVLTRQLVIARMLEHELQDKVRLNEDDLRNYFTAHADRFKTPDGKTPDFEQVKPQVQQHYLGDKVQGLSQALLEDALRAQSVQLYPEALGSSKKSEGAR